MQNHQAGHPSYRANQYRHIMTTVEAAQQVIDLVVEKQARDDKFAIPQLTKNGVLCSSDIRRHAKEHSITAQQASALLVNEFKEQWLTSPHFNREVGACMDLLQMLRPGRGVGLKVGSYWLKHQVETFFRSMYEGIYVPNTAMIVAAYGMGFKVTDDDGPNVTIVVNKKSMETLSLLRDIMKSRGGDVVGAHKSSGAEVVLSVLANRLSDLSKVKP